MPKRKPKQKTNKDDEGPLPAKVTPELRNKIYAWCGDSDMKDQHKQVDPALKLYMGCHCMIIDNDDISKGRANGTLYRVVGMKRKSDQPLTWKNYDGKKYTLQMLAMLSKLISSIFQKNKNTELPWVWDDGVARWN